MFGSIYECLIFSNYEFRAIIHDMVQQPAIGKRSRGRIRRDKTRLDPTHRIGFIWQVFVDHEDVREHMGSDECLVLARRRVGSSRSCYEFIKSFSEFLHAKEYARFHYLNRDKYVMLFHVTDSRLQHLPI